MNAEEIEKLSADVAKSPHTRVTKADIEAKIARVFYFNLEDAAACGRAGGVDEFEKLPAASGSEEGYLNHLGCTTVCVIVLRNGWHVTGETTPLDPANYDVVVGRRLAYDMAFRQLWPLVAYHRAESR